MELEKPGMINNSKNLSRLVIGLPVGIFLAEVIAMIIVYFIKESYWFTILIDAIITTGLTIPIIYFLSYRPLLIKISESQRANHVMQLRLRLMQYAFGHSLDKLLQVSLDEIEKLIGGTIGFFHFLHEDQNTLSLQAWSSNTIEHMCKAEGKGSHYSLNQAGIWADCVRLKESVVYNDYSLLKNRKGLPVGHAPILRILTVPIFRNGLIVAILGFGNKRQAFTKDDIDLVSTLADFAWDTIERKIAEDALGKSEEKFRTLVDWTYDWELWVNPQGKIIYNSPSCKRISGYPPEEFISDSSLSTRIIHPDDREFYNEHMLCVHDESVDISIIEYRIIDRDGNVHWIEHICRPLFGNDNHYLGRRVSNRDVTRRKLAEKELVERNEKEDLLTKSMHSMQLEMARDLHDTIGQNIGYLRMKLDYLSEAYSNPQLDLNSEFSNMLNVANESYNLVRGTLQILQSGGLVNPLSLFTQYASQVQQRSQFKVNVSSKGEPNPLSPNQVRQIFFLFREALSNIEKHASATDVTINLEWKDDILIMDIIDNGIGFSLPDLPDDNHYGLQFMQERIESLKGDFEVISLVGKGTTVKITIPLNQSENHRFKFKIGDFQ